MSVRVLTIGHSTRSIEALLALLAAHRIELVVDVRTLPRSRRHPHFDRERLSAALGRAGVAYEHEPELGGLRRPRPDSPHRGLADDGLRGFADHMDTAAFERALARLIALAPERPTTILCAEALPEHCHRSLIADALAARGVEVRHILDEAPPRPHAPSRAARIERGRVSYPDPSPELPGLDRGPSPASSARQVGGGSRR